MIATYYLHCKTSRDPPRLPQAPFGLLHTLLEVCSRQKIKPHQGPGKNLQPIKRLQPALLHSLKNLPKDSPFMKIWESEFQDHLNKVNTGNERFKNDLERLADLTDGGNASMNVFSKTTSNDQQELGRFTLIHPISFLEVSRYQVMLFMLCHFYQCTYLNSQAYHSVSGQQPCTRTS